jgi:hypothetical protein
MLLNTIPGLLFSTFLVQKHGNKNGNTKTYGDEDKQTFRTVTSRQIGTSKRQAKNAEADTI